MPLQEDYHITLDAFKGPLDLLLFLIRRAEVEITDIPIAEITDQYLAFLRQVDAIDIDVAGDFLVMAATLVEIKSRVLEARQARKKAEREGNDADAHEIDLNDDDPRYELVQQLLAYQRYRNAAEQLDHMREEFAQRFARRPGRHDAKAAREAAALRDDVEVEIEDAHVFDLFEAYERIVQSVDFAKLGEHQVRDDDTPIEIHQEDLVDRLRTASGHRITLQEAWLGRSRSEVIGLFLATLELVKQRRISVVQGDLHGEIMLELNEQDNDNGDGGDDAKHLDDSTDLETGPASG